MSLKAKIEAVIYASEEPVTLAQLMGLLGMEAQAELDRRESAQQVLALDGDEDEPKESPALPEADIEEATASRDRQGEEPLEPLDLTPQAADAAPQPTDSVPEPTDEPGSEEPEPTEESPIPEHPEQRQAGSESVAGRDTKHGEKTRDRRLREYFRSILEQLIGDYSTSDRGLEIREVAGGYRFGTKPEFHDAVRGFVRSLKPPLKLSLQALETLAVVAYKQPVTAPEISEIRGVDSGGVLGSLMARKLITTAGRKHVIGRPILYKTTRDFLLRFGLKDVSELPSIEEFEKMAGELADIEPVQEEMPMADQRPEESARGLEGRLAELAEPEKDVVEPQADGTDEPLEGSEGSSPGIAAGAAADEVSTPGDEPLGYKEGLEPRAGEEAPFESAAMDAELQREEAEELSK